MCIISKSECDNIRFQHLSYLKSLSSCARNMVYGSLNGKFDIHQRRLGTDKLAPVVAALEQLLDNIEQFNFGCFEDVYREVRSLVVAKGCWKNPLLLTYDISLRLAYRLDPVDLTIMPNEYLYLHAAPYASAKLIARKVGDKRKIKDGRVDANYVDSVFGCGQCDAAQKEHVLCIKHELIAAIYGRKE